MIEVVDLSEVRTIPKIFRKCKKKILFVEFFENTPPFKKKNGTPGIH